MRNAPCARLAGFTLLELMIVMAIIGVCISLAVVNLKPSKKQVLKQEVRRLTLVLETARDKALFSGRPVRWQFIEGEIVFFTLDLKGEWAFSNNKLKNYSPGDGVSLTEITIDGYIADEETVAVFMPHGFSSAFSVRLVLGDHTGETLGDKMGRIKMNMR